MRIFIWKMQIECDTERKSCCTKDFSGVCLGEYNLKIKMKKKEKSALLKCEGRDLDTEQISKFRPTSQMRLTQAAVVFQDKLVKRVTVR